MATTKKVRVKPKRRKSAVERRLEGELYVAELVGRTYGEQLHEIGRLLVRAKILTRRQIQKHGIRFALANKFEPLRHVTISRRKQPLKTAISTWKR